MMSNEAAIKPVNPPSMPLRWFKALRAYSFPASLGPVAVGVAAAICAKVHVDWWTVPFTALTALLIHIGVNLTNDVVDYEHGVDDEKAMGGSRVLPDRWLTPKQIRYAAIGAFILAGLVGAPVLLVRGWPLMLIGLVGVVGGYFYTAPPLSFKYHALGDPVVYLLCGPLLVAGVTLAVCGSIPTVSILAGLAVGGIVTGILIANNLRDIDDDAEKRIRTLASFIGESGTKIEYLLMVCGAFVALFVMSLLKLVPIWTLLTLFALPIAMGPIVDLIKGRVADQVVERTAKLHLVFNLLLTIGLILR